MKTLSGVGIWGPHGGLVSPDSDMETHTDPPTPHMHTTPRRYTQSHHIERAFACPKDQGQALNDQGGHRQPVTK